MHRNYFFKDATVSMSVFLVKETENVYNIKIT